MDFSVGVLRKEEGGRLSWWWCESGWKGGLQEIPCFMVTQRLQSLTPRSSLRGTRDNSALECAPLLFPGIPTMLTALHGCSGSPQKGDRLIVKSGRCELMVD